jgi:hypothetical protein
LRNHIMDPTYRQLTLALINALLKIGAQSLRLGL